ncbi:MAG: glycosyltransferase [Chloroflexota bacterium]
MRALFIANIFFPDPPGGTEVGILALAKALQQSGIESIVVAPHYKGDRETRDHYIWDGVPVWRYRVSPAAAEAGAVDQEDSEQSQQFEGLMKRIRPDVVSLHAWTSRVGVNQVVGARRLGIPIVLTCHLAYITCLRGSGMRWGKAPCDLEMRPYRCPACILQLKGLPRPLARIGALLPSFNSNQGKIRPSNWLFRGIRLPGKLRLLQVNRRRLWTQIDRFVAQSRWMEPALLLNGIPKDKICIAPACLYHSSPTSAKLTAPRNRRDGRLLVGFLGRFGRAKGIDLLVQATQRLPRDLPLEVHIHGVVQGEEEASCRLEVLELAKGDPRIRILDPLPADEVLRNVAQWDVLAIPSRVQEMRPQVILEAFSVGVPVIGSKCGGIPDLVKHECDGLLVAPDSVDDLANALWRLYSEPDLLERLRLGVPDVPSTEVLAEFMLQVYQSVIPQSSKKSMPAQ